MDLAIARGAKNSKLTVLAAILSYCNSGNGQAWPGNKLIMKKANISSKGTLDTSLRWLKTAGDIHPVANARGGRNTAVCWGFGLPAWSTPESVETSLKSGEDMEGENLPKNCAKPPQFLAETSLKSGEPTKRTERKEDAVAPSRRQEESKRPQNPEEQALWDGWIRNVTYGDAVYQWKRWREQQGAHVP